MTTCPECGAELEFDEVDVGVGTIRGNPGCPECHWTPTTMNDEDLVAAGTPLFDQMEGSEQV